MSKTGCMPKGPSTTHASKNDLSSKTKGPGEKGPPEIIQGKYPAASCSPGPSGQVRPRQGTEICNFGAPSPLEALHWIFSFFSSIYVQFSKTSPLKSGESSEKSSGENRVKSCHVCGCHGFFGPERRVLRTLNSQILTKALQRCLVVGFEREKGFSEGVLRRGVSGRCFPQLNVRASCIERGEKTPTPKISALLRKRPVLLRANFVLTKDRNGLTMDIFVAKCTRRGLVVKPGGGSLVKSRC